MKRVISMLCVALLCLTFSTPVFAQSPDFDRECSLSLQYATDGKGFENLDISIYQVAKFKSDGTLEKIPPFDAYDVSVNDITDKEDWDKLALTLSGYVEADSINATQSESTDSLGEVKFSRLSAGLYLIDEVTGKNEKGTYTFEPFMMYLPKINGDEYEYDVVAKPKAFEFESAPKGTEYNVLKLWKDDGNTQQRPKSVKVDIIKDGEVSKTVTLSAENNWSYTWTDKGQSDWNVVERDVEDGYTVLVDKKTTSFVITNRYESSSTSDSGSIDTSSGSVQTGNTSVLWPLVLILCLVGFVLIIVGLLPLRGYRHEDENR